MGLINNLQQQTNHIQQTIALPEATDERTLRAAEYITVNNLAKIILIGEHAAIEQEAAKHSISLAEIEIVDPLISPDLAEFTQLWYEMRKARGMTPEQAADMMLDPIIYAPMMVKQGKADGYVSGAAHTTADTIRPALQIIKTAEKIKTVSSFFIMELPESSPYYTTNDLLFYTDGALIPEPTVEQLADIAVATANSFKQLLPNRDPRIAFLSIPTCGILANPITDKMISAARLAKELAPDLDIMNTFDTDEALLGGSANILIFPDLQTGNIAYKLTERLAGAAAIGPFLQGIARPVSDLSRGCSWKDIADTIIVTAAQTGADSANQQTQLELSQV